MMPFALSPDERNRFTNDVGQSTFRALPQWGGIIGWQGRFILAFQKPDFTWALTDVSDGIPSGDTVIPIATVIGNVPKNQTSTWNVFWYSLPQNFLDVAKESAAAAVQSVVLNPYTDILIIAAIAVFALLYLPRPR